MSATTITAEEAAHEAHVAHEARELEMTKKGVQIASEFLVPGGSNFIKGDLKNGAVHAALGFAAKAFLGPIGLAVVIADSISKSQTGKYLHEQVMSLSEHPCEPAKPGPDAAALHEVVERLNALEAKAKAKG